MLTRKKGKGAEKFPCKKKCCCSDEPFDSALISVQASFEQREPWVTVAACYVPYGRQERASCLIGKMSCLLAQGNGGEMLGEVFPKLSWIPATRKCSECSYCEWNVVKRS